MSFICIFVVTSSLFSQVMCYKEELLGLKKHVRHLCPAVTLYGVTRTPAYINKHIQVHLANTQIISPHLTDR